MLNILFYGIFLYTLIIVLHILLWNLIQMKGEIIPLFFVFILLPLVIICLEFLFHFTELSKQGLLLVSLLYYSLAGVYIQTYPAIVTEIPSLKILLLIHKNGPLNSQELENYFNQDEMTQTRVELLEADRLIRVKEDSLTLNGIGNLLAILFIFYRKLLGLSRGEG